jgi:hypothetical protein
LFGKQRATPLQVARHAALPPVQQFCEAPRPPQTSPSGKQLPTLTHRRTPSASAVPQEPEQQAASDVQTSSYGLQAHIG